MNPSTGATRVERAAPSVPFWLSPPTYWIPPHLPVSAWVTHAPFAAWLVDVLRPRSIVELGSHFGFSCFAFAEASKRLGIPNLVHAIDTWEGDDHAGFYDDAIYRYFAAIVESDYQDRVKMHRARFHDARGSFGPASVDLLHIDGRHGFEDVTEDYEDWAGTVRDGGVILFHDIAETQNGFGVWRLWERLATPGRSFAFTHGHGLGVLAVGDVSAEGLRMLFESDGHTADRIRADFSMLGDRVARQVWLEDQVVQAERAWEEVRVRAAHEDQLAAHIEALEASKSWRVTAPLRAFMRVFSEGR